MEPASRQRRGASGARRRTGVPAALLALSVALVVSGCVAVTEPATPDPTGTAPGVTDPAERTGRPDRTPAPTERPAVPATDAPGTPPPDGEGGVTVAGAASPGASASLAPTPTPRPTVPPPSLTPGPERRRALAPTEVYGFLPSWELGNADTIDLDRITTLAWFGIEAGSRGSLVREDGAGRPTSGWAGWTSEEWRTLAARARERGVRVVITIQRFSWTEGQTRRTVRLLQNPANRIRLVAEIMEVVREGDADGVNLDFEPMPAEVSDEFTQLVRELRAAMNAVDTRYQLTFDAMPSAAGYDLEALTAEDAADAVFVMGYEFLTGASARSGSNAPLRKPGGAPGDDLATTVGAMVERIPPRRVILGLPWYGRVWSTFTDLPRSSTRSGEGAPDSATIFYRDAVAQAQRSGRRWDPVEASAWTLYPALKPGCTTCRVTWRQLWYDDVDATIAKIRFAQELELGGVGFWALGYQGSGPEMWSAIRHTVGGATDPEAPEGSVRIDPDWTDGERDGRPVVGGELRLRLDARDRGGSGLAYVRIAPAPDREASGELRYGMTYPETAVVTIDPLTGHPVHPLGTPRPRGPRSPEPSAAPSGSPLPLTSPAPVASVSPSPSPSPVPSPSPTPLPTLSPTPVPPADAGPRTLWVQWRDVAGNWSEPVPLEVWYRPDVRTVATETPAPESISSPPPLVPGEAGIDDEVESPAP